ncbi:MAG TPA: glycosyltransferase family 2 protein [Flavobacteriales bacterium]|nr:glycosyltransferase family 2 protein [Flavobacteriales bacterium]
MRPALAIIIPCLNEESALPLLLNELEAALGSVPEDCLVVVVDDGSTDGTPQRALAYRSRTDRFSLEVLTLPYTMGHQEAIYQGLLFASTTAAERFVVMDGDGQDDPMALPAMLADREASIVFVGRGARSESTGFKLGYALYRVLFRLVSGRGINFGNYALIDRRVLGAVLDNAFVHFAAFLSKQRVPSTTIISDRRARLGGSSKMGFDDLGLHAFRSLIEYSDRMLALFLKAFLYLSVLFLLSVLTIIGIKLFTPLAIPGWASNLSATMFNSLLLCLGFFVIGLMLSRNTHQRTRAGQHLYKRLERTP